jgi:uncharacterized protein YjiS (DUF1127 family)
MTGREIYKKYPLLTWKVMQFLLHEHSRLWEEQIPDRNFKKLLIKTVQILNKELNLQNEEGKELKQEEIGLKKEEYLRKITEDALIYLAKKKETMKESQVSIDLILAHIINKWNYFGYNWYNNGQIATKVGRWHQRTRTREILKQMERDGMVIKVNLRKNGYRQNTDYYRTRFTLSKEDANKWTGEYEQYCKRELEPNEEIPLKEHANKQ